MRFHRTDGFEVVTRITGPDHHYLALRFATGTGPVEIKVEAVPGAKEAGGVPTEDQNCRLADSVKRGVKNANARLGSAYRPAVIRFSPGDRFDEGVYARLAENLVEHAVQDQGGSPTLLDEAVTS